MAVAAAREGRLEDWWAGTASTDCTEAWLTTPTLTAPAGGVALCTGAPLISSTGEPARPCKSGDPRPGVCTHNSKRSTDVNTLKHLHTFTHTWESCTPLNDSSHTPTALKQYSTQKHISYKTQTICIAVLHSNPNNAAPFVFVFQQFLHHFCTWFYLLAVSIHWHTLCAKHCSSISIAA